MKPLSRHGGLSVRASNDRWLFGYADVVTLLFACFASLYAARLTPAAAPEAQPNIDLPDTARVEMSDLHRSLADAIGRPGSLPGIDLNASGRGIVIHRDRCRNLAEYRKQPAKWIPVNWTRGLKAEFESEIQVRTLDRVGLLAKVAGRISAAHTNIEHVRVDRDGDASALAFRLKVRDRRQLAQVVRSIRTIPGVVRVSRSAS